MPLLIVQLSITQHKVTQPLLSIIVNPRWLYAAAARHEHDIACHFADMVLVSHAFGDIVIASPLHPVEAACTPGAHVDVSTVCKSSALCKI